MKVNKIFYWLFTGLLCAWMTLQGITFLVNFEFTKEFFESLYVTPVLVAPLAIAKILAVAAILTDLPGSSLKRWAYTGLAIDFISATVAHINAGDGGYPMPVLALLLLIGSLFYDLRVKKGVELA